MQYFYDGQIRRYLIQTIRVLSNFTVRYGDGTLHKIPVMYGDPDRQSAAILRQNSENVINSAPRISVYITGLDLDKDRLSDATYVGKLHFRERDIAGDNYINTQGKNYTVERLMPTPFKLTMKVDIWSTSTEQKLQILEQILVLFNPSLELQTTDNYIDWTSLSVLNISNIVWSSRSVPVGNDSPIDIATFTVDSPIWISPPVKVKHLGVVTSVINSIYSGAQNNFDPYIDGLGIPLSDGDTSLSQAVSNDTVTISDYKIQVYNGQAILLNKSESVVPLEPTIEIPTRQGVNATDWAELFAQYPNRYHAGSSRIFLRQPDGSDVIGTFAISVDPTLIQIIWDADTYPANDLLEPYNQSTNTRANNLSAGTFDAVIDPQRVYPGHGMQNVVNGDRFLIVDDIGDPINEDGPDAWKSTLGHDFYAKANDIIEWDGTRWHVIFDSQSSYDKLLYQTNLTSGVQYKWDGVQWGKSFEGEYKAGAWRIEL